MVRSSTRGNSILDVFVTNAPHYWKEVKVEKSLLRTDHEIIFAYRRNIVKTKRTNSFFRDVREHRKLNVLRELENVDWSKITKHDKEPDELIRQLYKIIWPRFKNDFPLIKYVPSCKTLVKEKEKKL